MADISSRLYFDNNATTPISRDALEAMVSACKKDWGNPSAGYREGARAKKTLEWSRAVFAKYMDVDPETIIFTSCGTESNNIALRGVIRAAGRGVDTIVTSAVEHSSIRKTADVCGCNHVMVPVDRKGYVDETAFRRILMSNSRRVALVSIILGQNEVGTIQRIPALVRIVREVLGPDVPFHTDATQMMGKYFIHPEKLGVDLMTGSAHKFHGPRGVGILYARKGAMDPSLSTMTGGGQERGCRAGTENVPAIYGAAVAFKDALGDVSRWERRAARVKALRDTMLAALVRNVPGLVINGDPQRGMYNTLNVSFPDGHGHAIVDHADESGLAVGSGSACSKGKPSETLMAMFGDSEGGQRVAHGAIRISLSHTTTASQCEMATEILLRAWRSTNEVVRQKMREMEAKQQ